MYPDYQGPAYGKKAPLKPNTKRRFETGLDSRTLAHDVLEEPAYQRQQRLKSHAPAGSKTQALGPAKASSDQATWRHSSNTGPGPLSASYDPLNKASQAMQSQPAEPSPTDQPVLEEETSLPDYQIPYLQSQNQPSSPKELTNPYSSSPKPSLPDQDLWQDRLKANLGLERQDQKDYNTSLSNRKAHLAGPLQAGQASNHYQPALQNSRPLSREEVNQQASSDAHSQLSSQHSKASFPISRQFLMRLIKDKESFLLFDKEDQPC